MAKRSFLMLAHSYKPKVGIGGWFVSEKLDGQRCFWDGGISRGVPKSEVPWANTRKDERYKNQQIATGLWTRYGNVIHAPEWWLDDLPKIPMDGELYTGVNQRQELMEAVRNLTPDDLKWTNVSYKVFDLVPLSAVFEDGTIDETNFKIILKDCYSWALDRSSQLDYIPKAVTPFASTLKLMQRHLPQSMILPQTQLPFQTAKAEKLLEANLEMVSNWGGEGLILRNPISTWIPERSHHVLKVKKFEDDEGTVVGYITGRKTDKGSKLLGRMGALILDYNGKRLELSGFTDEERELNAVDGSKTDAVEWACEHPETECPDWIEASNFPRGTTVTFRYRSKSRDGIPQEARYLRRRSYV